MKIINLILKRDIAYDIPIRSRMDILIDDIIFPPPIREIDVVIKNIRVNHVITAENIIVVDSSLPEMRDN